MKKFIKKIQKKNRFKEYARILNGILELSNRELELFYLLLEINYDNKPVFEDSYQDILSTDIRKAIMKETMVTKSNFMKYVNKLLDKKILIRTDDGYILNDFFKPSIIDNKMIVDFELICEDE